MRPEAKLTVMNLGAVETYFTGRNSVFNPLLSIIRCVRVTRYAVRMVAMRYIHVPLYLLQVNEVQDSLHCKAELYF